MTTLTNGFEGITPSGTTISAANSGGASGSAFDTVTIGTNGTAASDNTHVNQGALAAKIATGATSATVLLAWDASMGTLTQVWFRQYLYLTAIPAGGTITSFEGRSGSTLRGAFQVSTSGKLTAINAALGTVFTFTGTIPTNAWFRIEGFIIGNASTGQMSLAQYNTPSSTTPDETITSAASVNTGGTMNSYRHGVALTGGANRGPYWLDDVGISSTGPLGPAIPTTSGGLPALFP